MKFTYEDLRDKQPCIKYAVYSAVKSAGYNGFDGKFHREDIKSIFDSVLFTYFLGKKDILFKKFDRWIPDWKKKKEILFRRF